MDTVTAVRNRILQLRGEREMKNNKLATISTLPPYSTKNILYGKGKNPKLITIKMICDGLGITFCDRYRLFRRKGGPQTSGETCLRHQ